MKHSQLITYLKEHLSEKQYSKIIRIIKSTSSGINYLSLKFKTEEDMQSVCTSLKIDKCRSVEKRYGIGFLFGVRHICKKY